MKESTNHSQVQLSRMPILEIWSNLSRRRRFQFCLLFFVILISACAELLSLGAVLPFIAILVNPSSVWEEYRLQSILKQLDIDQASDLLFPATLVFALTAIIASIIRLANAWLNGRLAAAVTSDISSEAYRRTLYQSYIHHLKRNSSDLINTMTTQSQRTVLGLTAMLQLISSATIAFGLFLGLLLIDWSVAIISTFLFGAIYMIIARTIGHELRANSRRIAVAATLQIRTIQEGLGFIREIALDGNQNKYADIFRKADINHRQLDAKNKFLGVFPRYAMEGMGLFSISILAWMLVVQKGYGSDVVPLLGSLALGAQKLLPALQQVYSSWSDINSYESDMKGILEKLNQPLPLLVDGSKTIVFKDSILFCNVSFRYDPELQAAVESLSFEIRRGEKIGIVGGSGGGKSTTLDLLMGLLSPTSGRILIDGNDLHDPKYPERIVGWRNLIAHVPQTIYLADCSIAENIAFGMPKDDIDLERVRQAAKDAKIDRFIESTPDRYGSVVGERGVKLSGGQRQRIGIARALYKEASILVFDEATSALDSLTESLVIEAMENRRAGVTILMIAHRLSSLKSCDRIIQIENGNLVSI